MRILILNTDYGAFLNWLYAQNVGLEQRSYAEQMQARNDSLFGVADFYSSNLRKLGHEAWDIHANNEFMQKAWAREHGIGVGPDREWRFRMRRSVVPWFGRVKNQHWFHDILAAQIEHYQPNVVLNFAIDGIPLEFFRKRKSRLGFLVGQHAAPLPAQENWDCYDLVLSSLPNLVEFFQSQGVPAKLYRLAFGESVLPCLPRVQRDIPVSFVGQVSGAHQRRRQFLNDLAERLELDIWGAVISGRNGHGPRRARCREVVWGTEMYKVLAQSKITLNCHLDLAGPYANNCRLYEATGAGACLVTDWKENLHEMFEPEKEVVTYRTPEECVEKIHYYLEHEDEREAIARSGQERTLREHTYYRRMEELVDILKRHAR